MGVSSETWWEHQPGERVQTPEGYPGVITEVQDGPGPGAELYVVELDDGQGGGEYGADELSPLSATASTLAARDVVALEQIASTWYPELGNTLVEHPPPPLAVRTAGHFVDTPERDRLARMAAELLTEANAAGWRPDYPGEPSPYVEQDGVLARTDPDTSIPHEAGWVRNLMTPPTEEYSYDWCRFREANRCFYPKGLDATATAQAGYAVWQPVDRGRCPRATWNEQEQCPVGAPGPNVQGGFLQATQPWSAGGQRGGVPMPGYRDPARYAAAEFIDNDGGGSQHVGVDSADNALSVIEHDAAAIHALAGLPYNHAAWKADQSGLSAQDARPITTKDAGFAGYVWSTGNEELEEETGDDEGGNSFDEDLWDATTPEITPEEQAHYEEYGEHPDQEGYDLRHDQAYDQALQQRRQESAPDDYDEDLHRFVSEHGGNSDLWREHGTFGDVDLTQPVWATQSHVSQTIMDHHDSPGNVSWDQQQRGTYGRDYLADEHPMFVTHYGRVHVTDGHHRVGRALQRGDKSIKGWHFNLDEKPFEEDYDTGELRMVQPEHDDELHPVHAAVQDDTVAETDQDAAYRHAYAYATQGGDVDLAHAFAGWYVQSYAPYGSPVLDQLPDPAEVWDAFTGQQGEGMGVTGAANPLYHWAPREARDSIAQHGLDHTLSPNARPDDGVGPPPGVYFHQSRAAADDMGSEGLSATHDLYEVHPSGVDLHPDPWQPDDAVYTTQPIPPERVRMLTASHDEDLTEIQASAASIHELADGDWAWT